MTEEKYKLLCSTCDSILLEDSVTLERVAIPWLHVIREHHTFLKQYEDLFEKQSLSKLFFHYIYFVKKKIIQYFRMLGVIVNSPKNFWIGNLQKFGDRDIIFVSHLINPAQLSVESDFYFGNIPNELANRGIKVTIVLINHTSASNKEIYNGINLLNIPRVVISKNLPIREELEIWLKTKKQSESLLQKYKTEENKLKKAILKKAIREATTDATKTSLRIGRVVKEIIRLTNAKTIVTTYEGHSWERIIFADSKSVKQNIKCIGYQHAALFRLQHAAKRSLGEMYDPDVIMTAGSVGLSQLKRAEGLSQIKMGILGSSRFLRLSYKNTTFSCIVLPEGIMEECKKLLYFSLLCAKKYPHINFIWRLHPIITINDLISTNPKLKSIPSNVEISSQPFEYDIARSKWSLYRGSTAIISAAANGVVPIYLSQKNELSIDPLYEIADIHHSVCDTSEFGYALETTECSDQIIDYCIKFYGEINLSGLIEQIKN